MGYPVGPWYAESSNIDNADRLRGKLLLIVGEMDTNVPPESTMRLVDALIKAGKDFELRGRPQRQPRHGRRIRPAADARLLRPPPARQRRRSRPRPPPTAWSARDGDRPDRKPTQGAPAERQRVRSTWRSSTATAASSGGAIERYEVDRGSLLRSAAPAGLSAPRRAAPRFHRRSGSTSSARLDFDRLEPGWQGRLPAPQEPPGPRAPAGRHPDPRACRGGAAGPVRPDRSSTWTNRDAPSSRWNGRRSPAT